MRTKTATMMLSIITCQKMEAGTLIQGYAYCSYQEKQQTAKSKERIDKLAAAQTAVNPFFNAIHCFSSMSKHAPHSSSSLYHPSNMKLLEVHIFCFLFTEKGSFSTLNFIKVNTLKKWESFYRTSGTSASQVEFFFRESRNQIATKKSVYQNKLYKCYRISSALEKESLHQIFICIKISPQTISHPWGYFFMSAY